MLGLFVHDHREFESDFVGSHGRSIQSDFVGELGAKVQDFVLRHLVPEGKDHLSDLNLTGYYDAGYGAAAVASTTAASGPL